MKQKVKLPEKYQKLNHERVCLMIRVEKSINRQVEQVAFDLNTSKQRLCEAAIVQYLQALKIN